MHVYQWKRLGMPTVEKRQMQWVIINGYTATKPSVLPVFEYESKGTFTMGEGVKIEAG